MPNQTDQSCREATAYAARVDPPLLSASPRDRRLYRRALGALLKSGMALAAVFAAAALPESAHGQAVNKINWDVSPTGGTLDGRSGRLVEGEFAVPLSPLIGFEAKGVGGTAGGQGYWGVTGDFFWRDPTLGAIGPIALYERNGGLTLQHYGVGGAFYHGPVDLNLRTGYQGGNVRNGGFGEVKLGVYATQDLEATTAAQDNAGVYIQTFGVEYLPHWQPIPNLSLVADGAVGQHGASRVLLGIRYYFGDEKSLQDRNHQDSVDNPLIFGVTGLSKPRGTVRTVMAPPPPPPPPPSGR